MQTFLPYGHLNSIRFLDPKRLGNQVYRETKTLLSGGWRNHPVSKMWRGFEAALCRYALYGLRELSRRGSHYPTWYEFYEGELDYYGEIVLPRWFGDERLHASHRAALLYKDPEWYGKYCWTEEPRGKENGKWNYYWPV